MSSNPAQGEMYSILYVIKVCQWLATGLWFSPGTLVSSTSKIDRYRKFWCRLILAFFSPKEGCFILVCEILAIFVSSVFNFGHFWFPCVSFFRQLIQNVNGSVLISTSDTTFLLLLF